MQYGEEYIVNTVAAPGGDGKGNNKLRGRVVYIHPQGRFAALEFTGIHGSFRECFFLMELTEKNRVTGRRCSR